MKTFAPNYYNSFKCIADRCHHTCCKGWEIYIDDATLERYKSLGDRFTQKLCYTDDGVCFCLTDDERCPFLNKNGLCDIISELGEEYISEICREHPRFYNWFSHRTEVGLGLSCEEAARIVLSQKSKTQLVVIEDDGSDAEPSEIEEYVLDMRDKLLDTAQDRGVDIETRIDRILSLSGGKIPDKSMEQWAETLSELEMMDSHWKDVLMSLKASHRAVYTNQWDICFEKLLVYFIYRHVTSAYDNESLAKLSAFACLSTEIIKELWLASKEQTSDSLCSIAMMYSAEIEYSEENTERLVQQCVNADRSSYSVEKQQH